MLRSSSRALSIRNGSCRPTKSHGLLQGVRFSSSDPQRRRENAARLRALRQSQSSPSETSSNAGVKYRYSKESTESFSEPLGGEVRAAEADRRQGRKKFVPFFQEVAEIEKKRKNDGERRATVKSIFASLGDPPSDTQANTRATDQPDLKTLLRSMEADSPMQIEKKETIQDKKTTSDSLGNLSTGSGSSEHRKGTISDLKSILHSSKHNIDDKQGKDGSRSSASSVQNNTAAFSDTGGSLAPKGSIFDAFPVPEPPPPKNTNAFQDEAYRDYTMILDDTLSDEKFGRKHTRRPLKPDLLEDVEAWLRLDEKAMDVDLPMMNSALTEGLPPLGRDQNHRFRQEIERQREKFMERKGWNQEQYHAAQWALKGVGHRCAKLARSLPLDVSWEKVKEAGMILDQSTLNTYLHACTTYTGGRRRSQGILGTVSDSSIFDILGRPGTDKQDNDIDTETNTEDNGADVPEELATFHDLLYKPTDQSLSIRVRALVAKGDGKGAEELLDSFPAERGDLRHRTYLPVLKLYLEKGDIPSALKVFKTMRDSSSVYLEPETYVQVISAIAENGFFSSDSEPIAGAENFGYSPASGPRLFDQIVSQMAEDVLEITSASARRLYTAFASTEMGKHLPEMHPLAPLAPLNDPAADGGLIASRVTVDAGTGVCPRSGALLRLINLESDQRKQLHDSLLELSKTSFMEFKQQFKRNNLDDEYPARALSSFASWLDNREGRPFTAIIDGANVAYYMQNFDQGKFSYYQLLHMVNTLEDRNENPLVIVPFKYQQKRFSVIRGSGYTTQVLDERELDILEDLTKRGKLFRVPKFCLDDYYWMLASVSQQTTARQGKDLSVSPGDDERRWAGTRPMIITNDQMRDHKLELIEPRLFRRWYSCHIVNYNFTAFVDDECVDSEIGFSTADFFSREIQGNQTTPSNGVEGTGGTAWHFPVSDWELNERFCIRIPE